MTTDIPHHSVKTELTHVLKRERIKQVRPGWVCNTLGYIAMESLNKRARYTHQLLRDLGWALESLFTMISEDPDAENYEFVDMRLSAFDQMSKAFHQQAFTVSWDKDISAASMTLVKVALAANCGQYANGISMEELGESLCQCLAATDKEILFIQEDKFWLLNSPKTMFDYILEGYTEAKAYRHHSDLPQGLMPTG